MSILKSKPCKIAGLVFAILLGITILLPLSFSIASRITSFNGYSVPFIGLNHASLQIENNPDAHNPTHQELWDFVVRDNTDLLEFILGEFECPDFAQTFHARAEEAGIRCAIVQINPPPFLNGHLICAVETSDEGLWFIEPQFNQAMNEMAFGGFGNDSLGFRMYGYYLFW